MPDGGCPIRRPLDRPLPARPQGFSQRGRVLHRQQAPRHPPCAHHRGSSHYHPHPSPQFPHNARSPSPARPYLVSPPQTEAKPTRAREPGGYVWCAPRQFGKRLLCLCPLPTRPSSNRRRVYVVCVLKVWSRGDSNPGPPPCKGGALPAKLRPRSSLSASPPPRVNRVVGAPGLEPGTSVLSGPRSNHLSYAPRRGHRSSLRRRQREWPPIPSPLAPPPPLPAGSPNGAFGRAWCQKGGERWSLWLDA